MSAEFLYHCIWLIDSWLDFRTSVTSVLQVTQPNSSIASISSLSTNHTLPKPSISFQLPHTFYPSHNAAHLSYSTCRQTPLDISRVSVSHCPSAVCHLLINRFDSDVLKVTNEMQVLVLKLYPQEYFDASFVL